MIRFATLALLVATAAFAQAPAPEPGAPATPVAAVPPPPPAPGTTRVQLTTSEGPILIDLETTKAPVTAGNFLHYVQAHRFDGRSFYRATKVGPGYGLIQGGVNNDPKLQFKPIAHEPTSQTGLTHADGTISMARVKPGSATSEFFITVGNIPSMDADPKQPGDNLGFAAFGHVVSGMDVVRHILDEPTSPTKGVGAMRGQYLETPVAIVSVKRLP
jgi:peptidyl-prolyl cis-trans isomerase A (cyclophilin A)